MDKESVMINVVRMFTEGASPEQIVILESDAPSGLVVIDQEDGKQLFFSYKEMSIFLDNDIELTPLLTEEEWASNLFEALIYEVENWAIGMKPNVLSQEV